METKNELLDDLIILSIECVLKAGVKIMEIYDSSDFGIETKDDLSPITKADKEANKIITELLQKSGIQILSEESSMIPFEEREHLDKLWIVDPIDGTKEFIKKNGDFTVNIALIENQIPILGVIFVPVTNELYFASVNRGSFKVKVDSKEYLIDNLIQKAEKLPITNQKKSFTFVASQTHNSADTIDFINEKSKEFENFEVINRGSSLKLCMIAEGKADLYPRLSPTMEWDIAAGHAICLYAGFDVKDLITGTRLIYNKKELLNNWFIAQ